MNPGRNDPCPCGSGKKYKKCCQDKIGVRPVFQPPRQKAETAAPNLNGAVPTPVEINQLAALFNAGCHAEVQSMARILLEQHPDSGLVWKILGASLHAQGQEALPAMQKAAKLLPDDVDTHFNLGLALRTLGRFEDAVASFRRALQVKPDDAEAHSSLGAALQDLGQFDSAATSYRRTLEIKPDSVIAHYNLGNALRDLGQLDDATASYRRAVEINPSFAEAHNNLGNTLRDLGQHANAVACFHRALEIKPEKHVVENFIQLMVRLRAFEEGAQFLRNLNDDFPDNGYLTFAAGWLLANAGHFEEAETLIAQSVELIPELSSKSDYSCSNKELPIRLPPYRNHQARELSDKEWRYTELSDACFSENLSLISKTRNVAFELSNICNYGAIHPRCPVHNYKSKEVLPNETIMRILDELGEIGFTGSIGWGCYTEPLIDPRLMLLVSYARKTCPRAKNVVTTNGFYLTSNLASDLVSAGIDQIIVSAYSMSEYLRFILLPVPVAYCVYNSKLEKRTKDNVYSRDPLDMNARCLPFILNLMVTCKGDLGLCCYDFERRYSFGSLHTATLRELLSNQTVLEVHRSLASGDRSILDACRRCTHGFECSPYWLMAEPFTVALQGMSKALPEANT